jgi:hypothetical protein
MPASWAQSVELGGGKQALDGRSTATARPEPANN